MREIRFFPDFGRRYPLWESFTDKYAMDPSDYELTPLLASDLAEYMRFWNAHFTDEVGTEFEWDSSEHERQHRETGDRLLARLRTEVAEFAVVLDERDF